MYVQSSPKIACICAETGPVARTIMSRHSFGLRASPSQLSAMQKPPVKLIVPSTTRIFRCVRRPIL